MVSWALLALKVWLAQLVLRLPGQQGFLVPRGHQMGQRELRALLVQLGLVVLQVTLASEALRVQREQRVRHPQFRDLQVLRVLLVQLVLIAQCLGPQALLALRSQGPQAQEDLQA